MKKSTMQACFGDIKPPSNKNVYCIVPAFFGDRFVGKELGRNIYEPSAEELDVWRYFCTKRLGTLS
jgi:hypothetical protein